MLKFINSITLLFLFGQLMAQVTLIKDISPGSRGSFNYSLSKVVNDKCYFVANDNKNGDEIWITDGTSAGTKLVKNLYPGSETCDPKAFGTNSNKLFFIANDSIHGWELWSTSGEEATTQLIFESIPGTSSSTISIPFYDNETFVKIDDKIYFVLNFNELFESDGTPTGTKSILKFNSINKLIAHEDKIYFSGNKKIFEDSIFIYDPKTNITSSIKTALRNPNNLISTPFGIIFNTGNQLHVYNSQAKAIKEVTPNIPIQSYKYSPNFAFYRGHYYIVAIAASGLKPVLLKINGKSNGTEVILNNAKDNFSTYGYFIAEGEYLYYLYNADSNSPLELWRTDGTTSGFLKLGEYKSTSLGFISASKNIVGYNGKIYYFADNGNSIGLYESNGTISGTKQLEQISDFMVSSQITTGLILLGNTLIFSADYGDKNLGQELYSYKLPIKTSTSDEKTVEELNLFPNPIDDKLYFGNAEIIEKMELYDLNGKCIKRQTNITPGSYVETNDLNSGVYLARCYFNGKVSTKSFVKR